MAQCPVSQAAVRLTRTRCYYYELGSGEAGAAKRARLLASLFEHPAWAYEPPRPAINYRRAIAEAMELNDTTGLSDQEAAREVLRAALREKYRTAA